MSTSRFNQAQVIHKLKQFLPAKLPLKDLVHHNLLQVYPHDKFHTGLHKAAEIFGYKTYLQLSEYRQLFKEGKIHVEVLKLLVKKSHHENLY